MKQRIQAIDIFRGITIAAMILVNTPGTWSHIYAPLQHATWHGYTPTDLIFPFFLFIVGCSISFALKNKKKTVDLNLYKKVGVRALKLILLGLFLKIYIPFWPFTAVPYSLAEVLLFIILMLLIAGLILYYLSDNIQNRYLEYALLIFILCYTLTPYFVLDDLDPIRIPGVLQRIGIVFFITSLIFLKTSWKTQLGILLFILGGYWFWTGFLPFSENVSPTFNRAPHNWVMHVDKMLLGVHMWQPDFDPEGIVGTLPSIATAIFGLLIGQLITSSKTLFQKCQWIFSIGIISVILGHLWDYYFPINKTLWTSSYVLVTAGWACVFLSCIFYITDLKSITKWGKPFIFFGSNSITVYFLSEFIAKNFYLIQFENNGKTISIYDWIYETFYQSMLLPEKFTSLLFALSIVFVYFIFAYLLYKNKIVIKV